MSRISPGSHPGRSLQWPSGGQQNTTRTASKTVFSHSVTNLTPCCQIYRMLVCIYMWQLWCSERQGGREQTETEGQVEFRAKHFFARSLTLQESQIASGSRHPPLFLPFPPPCLPLSFLPFILSSLVFFFFGDTPRLFSLFYSGSCGGRSCWAAWHRVTMSEGKQSLSRIPLSLWQSSSPMKPYQQITRPGPNLRCKTQEIDPVFCKYIIAVIPDSSEVAMNQMLLNSCLLNAYGC